MRVFLFFILIGWFFGKEIDFAAYGLGRKSTFSLKSTPKYNIYIFFKKFSSVVYKYILSNIVKEIMRVSRNLIL